MEPAQSAAPRPAARPMARLTATLGRSLMPFTTWTSHFFPWATRTSASHWIISAQIIVDFALVTRTAPTENWSK